MASKATMGAVDISSHFGVNTLVFVHHNASISMLLPLQYSWLGVSYNETSHLG